MNQPRRLTGIDALRGIAALLVLGFHAFAVSIAQTRQDLPWLYVGLYPLVTGFVGVHLFLVLSGFCIHLRLARGREQRMQLPFVAFWKRRFWRLYPAYLAAMALSITVLLATTMWQHNDYSLAHLQQLWTNLTPDLAAHLFMVHLFFPAFVLGLGNGVFWSLALEEHLYLLYSPLLWLRNRLGIAGLLAVAAIVSLSWRAACIYHFGERPIQPIGLEQGVTFLLWQAPSRWFEWCLGAAAAEAYAGRITLPRCWRHPLTMLAAGAGAIACSYHPHLWLLREPLWGLTFFTCINCVVSREQTRRAADQHRPNVLWRTLAGVGVFSYSIYLIHAPLLHVVKLAAYNFGWGALTLLGARLAAMGAILIAAYGFYRLFEQPFLHDATQKRPATPAEAAYANAASTEPALRRAA